jgi:hypothetical protein
MNLFHTFAAHCIGSRGEAVIDYRIVKKEAWERVEEFRIGERIKSDHPKYLCGSEGWGGKNRKGKG